MRKPVLCLAAALFLGASFAFAAEQTWKGKISDSKCGKSHKDTISQSGQKMKSEECVAACIKAGAKYVFVTKDAVYKISNQDFADLKTLSGHGVNVTGEMTGDTIKVSKIEKHGKGGKGEHKKS
jgi:hypothetical protein